MDVCRKCGAPLRDTDRFCSQCGTRISWRGAEARRVQAKKKKAQKEVRFRTQPARSPNYRESFQEGEENRTRALILTVTILVIMLCAVGAIAMTLMSKNRRKSSQNPSGEMIEILTEGSQITLVGEESGAQEDAAAGEAQEQAPQEAAQSEAPQPAEEPVQETQQPSSEQAPQSEDAPDTPAAAEAVDAAYIQSLLDSESTASTAEVFIWDLKHDSEVSVGDTNAPMYASALITVPILYTAASRIDAGELSMDTPVTYVTSIGGRGEATTEPRDGLEFPLSFFLQTMVRYSDNNCINTLIDFLTLDSINATCNEAGYPSVNMERGLVASDPGGLDNYISARDISLMVRDLYTGKFTSVGTDFMREYFRIHEGDSLPTLTGLAPGLADADMVLNQNGHGDTRYNEITVVGDNGAEYILTVMLHGDAGFTYIPVVTDIAEYVDRTLTGTQ